MCRLLAYLGAPVALDKLLYEPEHSLVVQSYQPQEMTAGLLNADGFGIGWYHPHQETEPFTYRQTLPIWNDLNLPNLSRYIESRCMLGYVRSATPGLAVDLSNCQPFVGTEKQRSLLFIHNGFIDGFRASLYRSVREQLSDRLYQSIHGTTDSEHIFALLLSVMETHPELSLVQALQKTLFTVAQLAQQQNVSASVNTVVSDGRSLAISRFAVGAPPPSLYWLHDAPRFPGAVLIASEPLFEGNWQCCPPQSTIAVGENLELRIDTFAQSIA
jgi:ergothioneine biosynthesis protein EgtC